MTNWEYIVEYLLSGALMVMMVIGIAFSAVMPALDRWNKRYFITLFSLFLGCIQKAKKAVEKTLYRFASISAADDRGDHLPHVQQC